MISFGLADLRGHLGLSFDDAAWIGAAFDMALIFIGPLTVFLGGLMGPRNILFFAATMFTVTCTFLPFIHNYSLLISAIVLALLLEAGVKSDRVVADAHAQPLNSPEDFWTIAMGARFRGTIQELDLEAHERVREATTEYISRHNVRSVETNAVFAIATKP